MASAQGRSRDTQDPSTCTFMQTSPRKVPLEQSSKRAYSRHAQQLSYVFRGIHLFTPKEHHGEKCHPNQDWRGPPKMSPDNTDEPHSPRNKISSSKLSGKRAVSRHTTSAITRLMYSYRGSSKRVAKKHIMLAITRRSYCHSIPPTMETVKSNIFHKEALYCSFSPTFPQLTVLAFAV